MDKQDEKFNNYIKYVEENNKIQNTLNTIIKYLCIIVLGVGVVFFLQKCSKTDQNPIIKTNYIREQIKNTDTLIQKVVQERIKIKTKLDTLNKIIYVPRDVIIKDSVLCDSLYSLAIVQKKMISNDSILITKLNVNIKNYKQLDTIQTKNIDSLQRLPKGRLKWFLYGFGSGFVTGILIK
jgi:hypothetical protein